MLKYPLITPADITPEFLKKREKLLEAAIENIGLISSSQERQLRLIANKISYNKNALPCKIELISGEIIDNVVLMKIDHYLKSGGIILPKHNFPNEIKISSIKNIFCSKNILPKLISDKISYLDETGMGYTVFYFLFENGLRKQAVCGGQSYFFDFKDEYKIEHIIGIEPFNKKNDKLDKAPINSSKYYIGFYASRDC